MDAETVSTTQLPNVPSRMPPPVSSVTVITVTGHCWGRIASSVTNVRGRPDVSNRHQTAHCTVPSIGKERKAVTLTSKVRPVVIVDHIHVLSHILFHSPTDERTVERGCTLQRPETCEHPCQKCNTTACNDQRATMTNPLRCAQCSGDECPDIDATDPTEVKPCTEGLLFGRTDQCYTYFDPADGSVQQRGCLSDLAKSAGGSAIAAQCLDATDGSCKLCTDDGCNARSVTCFVCNTDTDPGCADLLTESSTYRQACGTGRCVSLLDGATTRKGCLEDFNEVDCALKGTCQIFEGTLSNSAIYPADRIRCYQCSGSGCDEVQSSTSSSTCQQYDPDDECYTYVTGE